MTLFNYYIFSWREKGMEGFMMIENLNYPISLLRLQFLKRETNVIFQKVWCLWYWSRISSSIVFPASSSICLHLSVRLHPSLEVQPSHYAFELHSYSDKSGKPLILVCSLHSMYYMECSTTLFNFSVPQLIAEGWLFEIVSFNCRRWPLLKHCVHLLTATGHCSLCIFVSVHCFSCIPIDSERREMFGWSVLYTDLNHAPLNLFCYPSINVSSR